MQVEEMPVEDPYPMAPEQNWPEEQEVPMEPGDHLLQSDHIPDDDNGPIEDEYVNPFDPQPEEPINTDLNPVKDEPMMPVEEPMPQFDPEAEEQKLQEELHPQVEDNPFENI